MAKKSFKLLFNMYSCNEELKAKILDEIKDFTEFKDGEFWYDEEDEWRLREVFDKYSPLN